MAKALPSKEQQKFQDGLITETADQETKGEEKQVEGHRL